MFLRDSYSLTSPHHILTFLMINKQSVTTETLMYLTNSTLEAASMSELQTNQNPELRFG